MIYAPHILQVRKDGIRRDEYGRITASSDDAWMTVCECRCDDDTTQSLTSPNGETYLSRHHVVCPANGVKPGDYIRCVHGGKVRGEGEVRIVKNTNFLNYTEIWV